MKNRVTLTPCNCGLHDFVRFQNQFHLECTNTYAKAFSRPSALKIAQTGARVKDFVKKRQQENFSH